MSKLNRLDVEVAETHLIWLSGYIAATWPPADHVSYTNQDFLPRPATLESLVRVVQAAESILKEKHDVNQSDL